jgi:signal transduction histidine kinase
MFRPKPLPTYFLICSAPLLLLTGINYWNGIRTVDAAVGADLQDRLNTFTTEVDSVLRDQEKEIMRLALSDAMQQFVASKERQANNNSGSNLLSERKGSETTESSYVLPPELRATMSAALDRHGYFSSFGLFDKNRRPLLFADSASHAEIGPVVFQTRDFTSDKPQPDERVWDVQGNTLLTRLNPLASTGSDLQYTVGIVGEKRGSPIVALVGDLELDPLFSRIARVLETRTNRDKAAGSMVIVLNRSGKILYHTNVELKQQAVAKAIPAFMPIATEMMADHGGMQSFSPASGQDYLVTFAPLLRLNLAVAVARDRAQILSSARHSAILDLVLSLAIGLGAALLLQRHVQKKSRGIERVTEGLTAIAKGELNHHIDLKSSDDARGMADNINVVTERLRAQMAREAESRQFEAFVRLSAMLTHDLKNAIEGLSLTVGNMDRHFDNEKFRSDTMKSLTLATDKLKALVARLSKPLATLSGEHKRLRPTDLVPILKRVVSITAEPLREKHKIEFRLPPTLFALVDAERIERVIENLVLNALEAMGEKSGAVTIEGETEAGGTVAFSISDTGPGISQAFIDNRLFHPFATTKRNGVGLGLYTCREVVQANAGYIEVHSIEGAGTTFRVVLPSAPINERS